MGPTVNLEVNICEDAKDATRKGFFYREPVYTPVLIEKAVVVKNGMVSGKSSVDLIMRDKQGRLYVAVLSSQLLASIPGF